jgi:hypothetical protein
MKALRFVLLIHYCAGDTIKKNEMRGAYNRYGGEGFGGET